MSFRNNCLIIACFQSCFLMGQIFTPQEIPLNITGAYGSEIYQGGGSVSFVDFNDDGFDDLTFATNAGSEILFYQNTGDNFTLIQPGYISNTCEARLVVWVDYDNDGDRDIFVTCYDDVNSLYENDGNMNFTDVSVARGLSQINEASYGASFGDYDKDGYLDLYVTNFGPLGVGAVNIFYRYNSATNLYEDVTATTNTGNGLRQSLGSVFFDFDQDNDLDLYVFNDRLAFENSLYMNLGGGAFVDVSVPSGTNAAIEAMNSAVHDFNHDGLMDLYITDGTNSIHYQNNGDNTFTDVASTVGTIYGQFGWTGNFLDYDNDRDEDLYVTGEHATASEPNGFFVNDGTGNYTEPFETTGGLNGDDIIPAVANASGDFNNDGRVDLAVNRFENNNFVLYANNNYTSNNFIKINLEGTLANKKGIGCVLELTVAGVTRYYTTHSTNAYLSQASETMTLGIGNNTSIDQLVIHWPSTTGSETIVGSSFLINGLNNIQEGSGIMSTQNLNVCLGNHTVRVSPIPSQMYGAAFTLNSSSNVSLGADVDFTSNQEILLDPGFEVEAGSSFHAFIGPCVN